jgi:hypothetical protein
MRAALNEGGAEEHVRYLGYQEDMSGLLARADLLLMASRAESFCLAALEAMACGVPVLASAVGGLTELVEHGRHGFLYPLDDHEQAERLGVELLSDRDRYARMCRQAVRRARQFDREQVIGLYEDLYRDLIARRSAVGPRVVDPSPHGQRVSTSLEGEDFHEEVGVHPAAEHLAAQAALDGVALQGCHREAP